MRSPWRSVLVFALAPCFAFSSVIAPPEHVHEADASHPHAIGHRHFEAHDHEDADHDDHRDRDIDLDDDRGHDHDSAEFDHGDGRVIWLDDAGVQPAAAPLPALDVILTACFEAIPASTRWVAATSYNAAPPHGPPRPCVSLRGPPSHLSDLI